MTFTGLRIGQRLSLGYALLIALMLCLTAIGLVRVGIIEAGLAAISDTHSVKQRYAINFRGSVHDRAIALRDLVLEADDAVGVQLALIDKLAADYARSRLPLERMLAAGGLEADEKAALGAIDAIERRALEQTRLVIGLRGAHRLDEAQKVLLDGARPAYVAWLAAVNRLIDLEETKIKSESADVRNVTHGFSRFMILLSSLAILLAVLIGWAITTSVTAPIRAATAASRSKAKPFLRTVASCLRKASSPSSAPGPLPTASRRSSGFRSDSSR